MLCCGVLVFSPLYAEQTNERNPDPWERLNRVTFAFNNTADRYLLRPIAIGYDYVVPAPVDKGVTNVFRNLGEVRTIFNDLLQLKFKQGLSDTGRFFINSTFGVLGAFDIASRVGLERHQEDFGQTLATWGVAPGPYVVLPFFGPRTLRDSGSLIIDNVTTSYGLAIDHVPTRNELRAIDVVDTRAGFLDDEKLISGDRYTFLRDAYLSRRDFLVNDGVVEDDFGDEEEDWEDW